jgi:hypothetical protein
LVGLSGSTQLLTAVAPFLVLDVNNDGRPDLVSIEGSGFNVRRGLANAGGTGPSGAFDRTVQQTALGIAPISMVATDLSGDGLPDVVAMGNGTSSAEVLRNTANGFVRYPLGLSTTLARAVSSGEFTGGAPSDLMFTNSDGFAVLYPGVATSTSVPVGSSVLTNLGIAGVVEARTGLINSDLLSELVVAAGNNALFVYPGTGNPSAPLSPSAGSSAQLPGAETFVPTTGGLSFVPMELGDVTGDGVPDIVVSASSSAGHGVRVFAMTRALAFGAPTWLPTPGPARAIVISDVNGDGIRDVIVGASDVRVFLGGIGMVSSTAQVLGVSFNANFRHSLSAADVTGDMRPELFLPSGAFLMTLVNDGMGRFVTGTTGTSLPNALRMVAGDLNGDGLSDVVVSSSAMAGGSSAFVAQVLYTSPQGSLSPGVSFNTTSDRAVLGNLNRDTVMDLVVAADVLTDGGVPRPGLEVRFGASNATLSAPLSLLLPAGSAVTALAIDDFSQDSVNDLVIANSGGVFVYRNEGAGAFSAPVRIASQAVTSMASADFNLDGKRDLVLANTSIVTPLINASLPNGIGFALQPSFSASAAGGANVLAADVTYDGKPDLQMGSSVFQGLGTGQFTLLTSSLPILPPQRILADMDNDGALDVLAAGGGSSVLSVLAGLSSSSFGYAPTPLNLLVGAPIEEVVAARLNTDAQRDVFLLVGSVGARSVLAVPGVCR